MRRVAAFLLIVAALQIVGVSAWQVVVDASEPACAFDAERLCVESLAWLER
jgi:hypothetical protein